VIGRHRFFVPALLVPLVVTGCGGGDRQGSPEASTAPVDSTSVPGTEGSGVTFPLPSTTAAPTTTTTLPPEGLPEHHPVPPSGVLTLGGGSDWTQSMTVRGVPVPEVHDWFVGGIVAGGYTIVADQPRHVEFTGDGLSGVADLTERHGTVEVVLVLTAPPHQSGSTETKRPSAPG